MTRSRAIKPKINFSKGLLTEASPLSFPEDYFEDGDNIALEANGKVRRRKGLNAETAYSLSDTIAEVDLVGYEISEHIWDSVGGDGNLNFYLTRVGDTLHFYDNNESPRSAFKLPFTFELTSFLAPGYSNANVVPIFTASGFERLFVVGEGFEPFYISYDADTNTVSGTKANLEVRDFEDIQDGVALDETPASYSYTHQYNLKNRGWLSPGGTIPDPINTYFTNRGKYPSKNKSWWLGKNASNDFDVSLFDKLYTGTTSSAQGHYILDAFSRDRGTASGIPNLPVEKETSRPKAVAFFAGRIFWALGNRIYFNRVIQDDIDIGICYQKFDPTSEDISDLLDDDGGEIPILEAADILALAQFSNTLIVYASNGVWALSGADGIFKATGYSVTKLSKVAITSPRSLVQAESLHMFWSEEGIHVVSSEQVTQLPVINNATVNTIDTKYSDTTEFSKETSQGVYDIYNKQVTWLYTELDSKPANEIIDFTKYITYDLKLNAWTTGTFPKLSDSSNYPAVVGISPVDSLLRYTTTADIVDASSNAVTDSSGNGLVALRDKAEQGDIIGLKYLTLCKTGTDIQYTFCEFNDDTFVDYKFSDGVGVDAEAYLVPGHEQLGDLMTYKQAPYIMTYFERTEKNFVVDSNGDYQLDTPSGCLMQGRWDWTDSVTSGRWTQQVQCYRFLRPYFVDPSNLTFDYGQDVIVTKNKLRGKGRTLQVRFDSQPLKDFRLYGWSLLVDSNQSV